MHSTLHFKFPLSSGTGLSARRASGSRVPQNTCVAAAGAERPAASHGRVRPAGERKRCAISVRVAARRGVDQPQAAGGRGTPTDSEGSRADRMDSDTFKFRAQCN